MIGITSNSTVILPATLVPGGKVINRPHPRLLSASDIYTSLARVGVAAVIFPPLSPLVLLDHVDGMIFSGGVDVTPSLYGQEIHRQGGAHNQRVDEAEMALMRRCQEQNIPTLAICRGLQLLNVAFGGTLNQHLTTSIEHCPLDYEGQLNHGLHIDSGILSTLFPSVIEVNSSHHQGIDTLADCLDATATADDGLVEAVQCNRWNMVGVQWHPESIFELGQEILFQWFADQI